jgi:hypothetical protein
MARAAGIVIVVWRALAILSLAIAACGDHAGTAMSGRSVDPTSAPIPWISDKASFPPVPTPTPEPIPTNIRACRGVDLSAENQGAQGAGGWWSGSLLLTARVDQCLIHGLVELRFLDPHGQEITRTTPPRPGAYRDWAVAGEVQVQWLLSNWCEPRAPVGAIVVLLPGDQTPILARLDPPMGVGARCNSADAPKGATTMSVGPRPTPVPIATQQPETLSANINAPSTVIAGETMRYVLTLTNLTSTALALDPCPSYIESLGGHPLPTEAPPSNFPTFKIWDPIVRYEGGVKESHLLNCSDAPSLGPAASIAFEMRLDVPANALGSDTLRWQVIAVGGGPIASASITIVRR